MSFARTRRPTPTSARMRAKRSSFERTENDASFMLRQYTLDFRPPETRRAARSRQRPPRAPFATGTRHTQKAGARTPYFPARPLLSIEVASKIRQAQSHFERTIRRKAGSSFRARASRRPSSLRSPRRRLRERERLLLSRRRRLGLLSEQARRGLVKMGYAASDLKKTLVALADRHRDAGAPLPELLREAIAALT